MHDVEEPVEVNMVQNSLFGLNGASFAVVDDEITIEAAMATRAQSVPVGNFIAYYFHCFRVFTE